MSVEEALQWYREHMKKQTIKITVVHSIVVLIMWCVFNFAYPQYSQYSSILYMIVLFFPAMELVNYYILIKRIEKGWFGNNAHEAKLIIDFVLEHQKVTQI